MPTLPDPWRLRRGDPVRQQADRGRWHRRRGLRRARPGRAVNEPMRISNWTQFARLYSDPEQPGQRPVHGGRVPRARRLRLLQQRRQPRLDHPRRQRADAPAAARRAPRRGRPQRRGAARGRARRERPRRSTVEVTEEPPPARPRKASRPTRSSCARAPSARNTRACRSSAGGTQSPRRSMRPRSWSASRRPAHRCPTRGSRPAATRWPRRRRPPRWSPPRTSRVTSPRRKGWAALAPIDEVTMLVMPDVMTLNGDGAQMRDLQGKMIAHCENAGEPHGDPRRARRPAAAGGARVAHGTPPATTRSSRRCTTLGSRSWTRSPGAR